jgi:hypothetical protein
LKRWKYENDVFYEVWRSGGNPDRIDDDRVSDYFYDHLPSDEAARHELQRQRPKPELQSEEEWIERQDEDAP